MSIIMFTSCTGQNSNENDFTKSYKAWTKQAYEKYLSKDYIKSAEFSVKVYDLLKKNNIENWIDPVYNAACAYTLAGEKEKAFEFLEILIYEGKFNDYEGISNDKDFDQLRGSQKWNEIINQVKMNNFGTEKKKDLSKVKEELQDIYMKDQEVRFKLMNLNAQMNKDESKKSSMEKEFKTLVTEMKKSDAQNLIRVSAILDDYGWLGQNDIGFEPSQALFLVIQHADLNTQLKYLPMLRKAAKEGKTLSSNLAILEDRVALRQGKKQIYGSQVWINKKTGKKYVDLLEDPLSVDKRRAEVGLPSMNQYLSQFFQMEWDAQIYIDKILPELIKLKSESKNGE